MAVTGLGLVTPAGVGRDAAWAGVRAGNSTALACPGLDGLPVATSSTTPTPPAPGTES
ncbi:hypothetical protein [Streptomyces sp. NPDC002671]